MSEKPANTTSEQPEKATQATPENSDTAPEQHAPGQEAPERQPDEVYAGIAKGYIDSYVGNIDDEARVELEAQVLEHIKNIDVQTKDELVKAYSEIIDGLKEYARARGTTPAIETQDTVAETSEAENNEETEESAEDGQESDVNRPEGVPTTQEVAEASQEVESNKGKYSWKQKARMILGLPSLGIMSLASRENKFARGEGESDAEYDKRMKRHKWSGILATAATVGYFGYRAYAGYKGFYAGDDLDQLPVDGNGGNNHDIDLNGDGVVDGHERAIADGFGYDFADDPFNGEHKTGVHNWGNPLEHRGGETISGLTDLQDRWKNSPEQMSTVAAEIGLDGFTTENIEEMADKMKKEPEFAQKTHEALQAILNDPATKISEGAPLEPGTYGSYYETMVDKDGVISYDNNINEAGSVIKVEYKDADGNIQVIEFKRECGGQVIHRNPAEEAVAAGAPAPLGVGNGPVSETPVTPGNPGEGTPPGTGGENPPPETTPPEQETTPPETLAPKSENPDDYEHIEGAPPAEFGGWAPPAQTDPTPPTFTDQQPGSEIGYDEPASQAPDAQPVTPEENQQRENTPPAEGATTPDRPGTETENPF